MDESMLQKIIEDYKIISESGHDKRTYQYRQAVNRLATLAIPWLLAELRSSKR